MTISTGNIIEVRLAQGYAYGLVLAEPAAYPPAIGFLPQIHSRRLSDVTPDLWNGGYVVLLSPLDRASANGTLTVLRSKALAGDFPEPKFRVPVRDRRGRILYQWQWNAGQIELPNSQDIDTLPIREIVPLEHVAPYLQSA